MTKIAIIDDHEIVRIGLRSILSMESDYTILKEFETAGEVKEHISLLAEQVDIIFLDLELPDATGFELLDYLVEHITNPKIIILTSHSEEEFAIKAIKKGASGFLTKAFDIHRVNQAIVSVLNGGLYLTPHATELLRFGTPTPQAENIFAMYPILESLSDKEKQVFHYICEGLTVKEISYEMDCSIKSISTYKSRLMEKLDAKSLVDIIVIGVKNGFIQKSESIGAKA